MIFTRLRQPHLGKDFHKKIVPATKHSRLLAPYCLKASTLLLPINIFRSLIECRYVKLTEISWQSTPVHKIRAMETLLLDEYAPSTPCATRVLWSQSSCASIPCRTLQILIRCRKYCLALPLSALRSDSMAGCERENGLARSRKAGHKRMERHLLASGTAVRRRYRFLFAGHSPGNRPLNHQEKRAICRHERSRYSGGCAHVLLNRHLRPPG